MNVPTCVLTCRHRAYIAALLLLGAGYAALPQAQEPSGAAEPRSDGTRAPLMNVLVARPVDAADPQGSRTRWVSALMQTAQIVRISTLGSFAAVPREVMARHIAGHGDFSRTISDGEYFACAEKVGVTHIVKTKYEILDRGSSLQYYAELLTFPGRQVLGAVEKSFPLQALGIELDDALHRFFRLAGVAVPPDNEKNFHTVQLGSSVRELTRLGTTLADQFFRDAPDHRLSARRYESALEASADMRLGFWLAAQSHFLGGQYGDAVRQAERFLDAAPAFSRGYELLGEAQHLDGSHADAIAVSERARAAGVRTVPLLVTELRAHQALEQRDGGYAAALRILEKDTLEPTALAFVARWRNDEGRIEEGLALAQRLLRVQPNNGNGFLEQGRALVELDKAQEAVLPLTQAAVLLPDNAQPQALLASIRFAKGEYAQAAKHYEAVLAIWTDTLELYLAAADAYERAANRPAALGVLKRIEPRHSDNRRLNARMGLLTFDEGDTLGARPYLDKVLRGSVEDPRIFMALAAGYAREQDYLPAIRMYEQAVPLVEDKSAALLALGELFLRKGEPGNALVYLERVERDNPTYPGLHRFMGDARLAASETEAALVHYRKEVANHGADPYVQTQIARLVFESGNRPEARREALRLTKVDPDGSRAWYWLASLSLDDKDIAKSREYLREAQARGEADEEMYVRLGRGYAQLGSSRDAEASFRKALELNPRRIDGWIGLADVLLAAGSDSAAAWTYMHVASIGGEAHVPFSAKAGRLFEQLRLTDSAREAYNFFLGRGQVDDDISRRLSRLETAAGNHEAVIMLLAHQRMKESLTSDDKMRLAHAYLTSRQWEQALVLFEEVAGPGEKHPEALEHAARCAVNANQTAKGIALLERFLKTPASDRHAEYAFEIGTLYEKLDNGTQARRRYAENIKDYPRDIRSYEALAKLCTVHEDWPCVEETLERAIVLPAATVHLRKMLAQTYEKLGKRDKAVEIYSSYLGKGEADTAALLSLGRLHLERQEYDKAVQTLNQAFMLMPRSFEAATLLGEANMRRGNNAAAIDAFTRAREINSRDRGVLQSLTQCYRENNDTRNLITTLREWLYLDENNVDVKIELGRALLESGSGSEAIRLLEQAVRQRPGVAALHRTLAAAYRRSGDARNQLTHLQAALPLDPVKGDLYEELGTLFLSQGRRGEALGHFRNAVEADPDLVGARFEYARLLYDNGSVLQAHEQLLRCVEQDRDNEAYQILLARASFQLGRSDEAMAAVRRALVMQPASVEALALIGFLHNQENRTDSAKVHLERAIAHDPQCAYCYQYLGDAWFYEGGYERAAENIERSLALRPYDEESSIKLGRAVLLSGYPEKAGQLFEKILSLNPRSDEAFYWLCRTHLDLGRLSAAEALFKKTTLDKRTGWVHLAQGDIYEARENHDAALISYSVATRLMPGEALTEAAAGRMNLIRRDFDRAVVNFGKALGHDPNNPQYLLLLGRAYEGLTDYSSALQLYGEILLRNPNYSEALYLSARALSKSGEHRRAVEMLENALRRTPSDPRISMALGHEYRMTEEYDKSVTAYENAVQWGGNEFVEGLRFAGLIHLEKHGDQRRAKRTFERYLRAGGANEGIRELVRTLE